MTGPQGNSLRIERLQTLEQFEQCVAIQSATWNYSAQEMFPRRAFLLAEKLGGHVLGALDGDTIVAFNVAYPGYRKGDAYLHSQMLAVLPDYRNSGIGRRLKLAQREIALADGLDLIEWTYDPLEIKNAFLNLHRLGAITRRYVRDFYGPSSSPLQGGLPTDRLYAEWWIRSEHVTRALASEPTTSTPDRTITVAAAIYAWKASADPRAALVQAKLRQELEAAFAEGLVATGYERCANGDGRFQLTRDAFTTTAVNATNCEVWREAREA